MQIRQTLNKYPIVAVGVVALVVAAAVWQTWSVFSGGSGERAYGDKAYFTADDGATYFVDRADNIVPYMRNGKEVVRAHVYKCPSKPKFVAFLQRYTPAAQEALKEAQEAKKAGRAPKNPGMVAMVDRIGSEYKKPGAGNPWRGGDGGDVVVGNAAALCDNKPGEIAELTVP